VTSQSPDQYDFTNPGNPVLGTVVYFTTGEGNSGSVFVPQSRYSVKTVHQMVSAHARTLDEVGAVNGNYS
jgi:hypothetical protein